MERVLYFDLHASRIAILYICNYKIMGIEGNF